MVVLGDAEYDILHTCPNHLHCLLKNSSYVPASILMFVFGVRRSAFISNRHRYSCLVCLTPFTNVIDFFRFGFSSTTFLRDKIANPMLNPPLLARLGTGKMGPEDPLKPSSSSFLVWENYLKRPTRSSCFLLDLSGNFFFLGSATGSSSVSLVAGEPEFASFSSISLGHQGCCIPLWAG